MDMANGIALCTLLLCQVQWNATLEFKEAPKGASERQNQHEKPQQCPLLRLGRRQPLLLPAPVGLVWVSTSPPLPAAPEFGAGPWQLGGVPGGRVHPGRGRVEPAAGLRLPDRARDGGTCCSNLPQRGELSSIGIDVVISPYILWGLFLAGN